MSIEFKALFLALAFVLFVIAAWDELKGAPNRPRAIGLIAAGLACGVLPFAWDAVDAAVGA